MGAELGMQSAATKLQLWRVCATRAIGDELDRRTRGNDFKRISYDEYRGTPKPCHTREWSARRGPPRAQRQLLCRGREITGRGGEKSRAKTTSIYCGGKPAFEGGTLPNVDEARRHRSRGLERHGALPSRRID